jgi:hypothetical protein
MLCWQAVSGGLPHIGYSDPIATGAARRLTRGWTPAGRIAGLSAFVRGGQVLCVLDDGGSKLLHVGARSRRDFLALTSELGVGVNEA